MKSRTDNEELQELALQVIDMLGVALYFAGVKPQNVEQAIDAYVEELDENDEDETYGQEEIIAVIKRLKVKKPFLFADGENPDK